MPEWPAFVGRTEPLARLTAVYQATTAAPGGVVPGWAGLVLVTGEAGIGKTALLTQFTNEVAAAGATVVWGTCWDGDQVPAWWPWTQALRMLIDQHHDLAAAAGSELAAIVPDLATGSAAPADVDTTGRIRVLDAAARLLHRAATGTAVVVVLDDLQWADESTVDLLRFMAHPPHQGGLLLVGAYRPHEPPPAVTAILADLASTAEPVPLRGLSASEVADLAQAVTGAPAPEGWVRIVHDRSGGHPFYARELCRLLATTGTATDVPVAIRDVIRRRLARLSAPCASMLDATAVAGTTLLPDVLAEVSGDDATRIAAQVAEAAADGIIESAGRLDARTRFVHDLYRETIYTALTPARRLDLHHRIAIALLHRHERGSQVFDAELAHHFTAAIPAADTASAVTWAHAAARVDSTRFAFAEAADHLTRLRSAVAAAGRRLSDADLVGLFTPEADLRLRAGDAVQARELLDTAWAQATATGRADLVGAVALGLDRIDARFAMPRADLVAVLDTARHALHGAGTTTEATGTAALARQLQHSVPADRPQARPLAERAVTIARGLDDPATLASCLLAQHDTLWTPGTATARAAIAAEIIDLARRSGDPERHAQALLLSATAQLERVGGLPRDLHRVRPRHPAAPTASPRLPATHAAGALALLDGDIATGERLSAEAATLGETVGDRDAGNVRMSQRLEVVRARNHPAELWDMAAEAVAWWIGAPAHAHAVAAGFCARVGDLDAARRELDTVLALEDWRTDRSYLWSIFIGEMVTAAVALDDWPLCRRLLDDLLPISDTCAVNAALVCFMGAHAHRVGLLYAALDQADPARRWLHQAMQTHRRLGARAWEAETGHALARLGDADPRPARPGSGAAETGAPDIPMLRRVGDMWRASYRGHTVYLRDTKGLNDLAALLACPGTDLSALHLAGGVSSDLAHTPRAEPVLDRTALIAYRRRLAELDDELSNPETHAELAHRQRASDEREQLLTELHRATRPDGSSRVLGNTAAERARKAVTFRIRDAIRRITDAHPDLGTYLDRTIRTGTTCRYEAPTDGR
jgi:hypothetical protein